MIKPVRLADHTLKIGSGQTPAGGYRAYSSSGVPLIRSQNVHMGSFSDVGLAFISPEIDDSMRVSRVEEGDVLLNITGASIGRVCVVPDKYCPANVNQHVCIIRCDKTLDPSYVATLLASPVFQKMIWDRQAGGTRQALTKQMIENFQIPLLPIEDQKRVASSLTSQVAELEAGRQAANRQLSETSSLKDAIFRDAFHEVTPIAVPPTFPTAPTGWAWKKLSSVAALESGHTPSRLQPEWWGGDISWLSLTEIRALDGTWVEQTQIRTNPAGIANSSARILPRGTVCLSRTASVGFVAIMAEPMATSQDFANWVCGDDLDPEFLMFALIASRKAIRDMAKGATHKTIYMPALGSFHICAPVIDEQRRIAKRLKGQLAEVTALQAALTQRIKDIAALPKRILAQAFEI